MNRLEGHIKSVEVGNNLSMVTVLVHGKIELKAIVIETPETAAYLKKNEKINLLFKETEVILATGTSNGLSLLNKIPGVIRSVERGHLLSKIEIATPAGELTAVVGSVSVEELGLREELEVIAMIKINEVMLSEK